MLIQVNFSDIESSPALLEHVESTLTKSLAHVAKRITRLEVHLRDDKQKRRGPDDKRCTVEARVAGRRPLAVEARARDIYLAVTDSAAKIARALTRRLARD